jgi:hypothetical protein
VSKVNAFCVAKIDMKGDGETQDHDPNLRWEVNSQSQWNMSFDTGGKRERLRYI